MQQSSTMTESAQKRPRGGSRKGIPNKTTATVREAIARMAEANAPKLGRWLNEVYETDGPAKAIECYAKLVEYHIPKQRAMDIVTTHIDLAAILDRARSRLIDVTPSQVAGPSVAQIEDSARKADYVNAECAWKQQQDARVQAELSQPYDPTEFEPGEGEG